MYKIAVKYNVIKKLKDNLSNQRLVDIPNQPTVIAIACTTQTQCDRLQGSKARANYALSN